MHIDLLSLFPNSITPYLNESIIKRAQETHQLSIRVHNFREFSTNKHHKVDDIPFGGRTGMVLQAEPLVSALQFLRTPESHVLLFCPKGEPLSMSTLNRLRSKSHLILVAGHYEGFDARIESYMDELLSIGDYVVTGGELPALIVVDAISRLLPGVLGNEKSFTNDSFYNGLLDWDIFTRPQIFDMLKVPDILVSGNHKKIEAWKQRSALVNTLYHRPDMLAYYKLNKQEQLIFKEHILEEDT